MNLRRFTGYAGSQHGYQWEKILQRDISLREYLVEDHISFADPQFALKLLWTTDFWCLNKHRWSR